MYYWAPAEDTGSTGSASTLRSKWGALTSAPVRAPVRLVREEFRMKKDAFQELLTTVIEPLHTAEARAS